MALGKINMVEKLTYKDFLINHYNLILKGIVRAEVELAILEASPISTIDQDIGKRAKEMAELQSFVEEQKKELKVVIKMLEDKVIWESH